MVSRLPHGIAQYHAEDPRKPFLVSEFKDGALALEITYPNDDEVTEPPDSWRKRRTDITVYVDKNARLSLETLHDAVVVRGYAAPIQVHSESGDVEIKADNSAASIGSIRFNSCSGSGSPEIFDDGFESNDTSAWSSSVP